MTTPLVQDSPRILQSPPVEEPKRCPVSEIALYAIGILGLFFTMVGCGYMVAGLELPGLAFLVAGLFVMVLGLAPRKKEEPPVSPIKTFQMEVDELLSEMPLIEPGSVSPLSEMLTAKIHAVPPFERSQPRATSGSIGLFIGDALGVVADRKFRMAELSPLGIIYLDIDPSNVFSKVTQQACAIIRAIDQHKKSPSESLETLFAKQLNYCSTHGVLNDFEGQYKPMEPATIQRPAISIYSQYDKALLQHENFPLDPINTALDIWKEKYRDLHAKGSLIHGTYTALACAPTIAAIYYKDLAAVVEKTILFTKVTDAAPRTISAAVMLSVAVALLLQGREATDEVNLSAMDIAKQVLLEEMEKRREFYEECGSSFEEISAAYIQELESVLSDNFTKKSNSPYRVPCNAFSALKRAIRNKAEGTANPFKEEIISIVNRKKDVICNAAAVAVMLGAYLEDVDLQNLYIDDANLYPWTLEFIRENEALIARLSEEV